jgi:hypothetical protein
VVKISVMAVTFGKLRGAAKMTHKSLRYHRFPPLTALLRGAWYGDES